MAGEHTEPAVRRSVQSRVAGIVRAAVSYTLFFSGVLALAFFFAPHVGVGGLGWQTLGLPAIAAPTEGDAVINVAPLIAGTVVSSVGVWLR